MKEVVNQFKTARFLPCEPLLNLKYPQRGFIELDGYIVKAWAMYYGKMQQWSDSLIPQPPKEFC